jgi:hypothetical protein
MNFSQAVFLSLLYQEYEWYTADYISRLEAVLILRVLAALAAILFVVYLWWRRRNRAWARSEHVTYEPDKKAGKQERKLWE